MFDVVFLLFFVRRSEVVLVFFLVLFERVELCAFVRFLSDAGLFVDDLCVIVVVCDLCFVFEFGVVCFVWYLWVLWFRFGRE